MNQPSLAGDVVHLRGPVLVGDGEVWPRAWVVGGQLARERPLAPITDEIEGWVLPGLVDLHCHIGLGPDGPVDQATALRQARADLASGVTLVRDAGSPSDTRWLAGREDAPEIIRCGRHLALPKRYFLHFARELDQAADLPAAAEAEARAGDGWIKVVADWIDRADGSASDLRPLWDSDSLREATARVHAAGARVTAHTFATESADDLLAAGVDCLEHGTGLSDDHIDRVAAAGVAVVPTLLQIDRFDEIAAQGEVKYPRFAARMRAMHVRRHAQVRDLHEAGVTLLLGTDAGGTIGHGRIAEEAAAMVAAGVPPPDVVAAASWTARDFLRRPPLTEGATADLVVLAGDPRSDIRWLAEPVAVMRRGVVVGSAP